MSHFSDKKATIETEFYEITVFFAFFESDVPIPCIRLDRKRRFANGTDKPRLYTRNMALNEIEALTAGVALLETLP